jgi:hypothetical protein
MSHKFLVPILAAVFVVAPAVLPSALVSAMAPGLSGAAQAKTIGINGSSSPTFRTTKSRNPATTPKAGGDVDRMGGGGGPHAGGALTGVGGGTGLGGGNVDRMGGGGGANTGGGNVNRMGGGGGTTK